MSISPIRPACFTASALPLRSMNTWPGTPVLGQLLPAQVWLQDAGGRQGAAVLWRGRALAIYDVTCPTQHSYQVWADSRGQIIRVEVQPT